MINIDVLYAMSLSCLRDIDVLYATSNSRIVDIDVLYATSIFYIVNFNVLYTALKLRTYPMDTVLPVRDSADEPTHEGQCCKVNKIK